MTSTEPLDVQQERLDDSAFNSAFPLDLPPSQVTLDDIIRENLLDLDSLEIHSLNATQRFLGAETNLANLYSLDLSQCHAAIGMVRDHMTGELRGFTEEFVDMASHGNKLAMNRNPLPCADIRGSNVPFMPGGFTDDDLLDDTPISTGAQLDFENDLLTIPPNFTHGANFSSQSDNSPITSQTPSKKHIINLNDILQFDEDDTLHWTDDVIDETCSKTDDVIKTCAESVDNRDMNSDSPDINDDETVIEDGDTLSSAKTSATIESMSSDSSKESSEEWAVMVDSRQKVDDFYTRIPNMAHTWPFELDAFQKQAILCLENNQNVFVAAHTSAGKTVVAEYAIALSLNHLTRTIYTSPIKALSNQKFRDFRQTFNDTNIGLVTGDIQLNTTAACLIMTTEILRSMLYHGSEVIRDLEWVIFDEVHYINDSERGVVWEEVLIMLPQHVNIVLLSATVPNTKEFAAWVGKTKKKQIYVISTLKRPVPLEHYLYTGNSDKTSKELFTIVDSKSQFLTKGYDKAVAAKSERETKSSANFGARGHREGRPQQDRATWLSLIKMLERTDRLPAVAFTFSKKKIDSNASGLTSIDLTTNKEKGAIHVFIHNSISQLKPPDRLLPQVTNLEDLLKRGIGIHHSGVLPILKEVVELLFQRGLVKILFATETFAMGVNMPARTVLFDTITKHDGTRLRLLHTAEYIQMAGRAGRRGIDTTGTVIILCKGDVMRTDELHRMILGKPNKLESHFRLTYSMILNLCRVEQLRMEDMMKRSFTEFHAQNDHIKHRTKIEELRGMMNELQPIVCFSCGSDLEEYYNECREYCEISRRIHGQLMTHPVITQSLTPGRVVQIQTDLHTDVISVILSISKRQPHESPIYTVLAICDQQLYPQLAQQHLSPIIYDTDSFPIIRRTMYRPEGAPWGKIFTCELWNITDVTKTTIKVTGDVIVNDFNKRCLPRFSDCLPTYQVTKAIQELARLLQPQTELTFFDPIKDMKIREIDLQEQIRYIQMAEKRCDEYNCVKCPHFYTHFCEMHKQQVLKDKFSHLKHMLSEQSLSLLPEYTNRIEVLKRLQFLDKDANIQLKGRVACELSSATLLVSEIIFENVLENLLPSEIAAVLSCVVFQEHRCSEPNLTETLQQAMKTVTDIGEYIYDIEKSLHVECEDFDKQMNFGLMEVVFEWARGMPFADITQLTDVQEGIIVRTIQRLHEVLRDVKDAARIIGNPVLYEKMERAAEIIKRDIVFAASLYMH